MKTFIVVVNADVDAIPGSPLAAAVHQGYGEEYVVAYLRHKLPAGSLLSIESAKELGVETVLSDGEERVLLNPTTPKSASNLLGDRRDDGPRYF